MSKYKILADLHTHTIASGHAFSTVKENVLTACEQDLKYIALTDHLYYPEERFARLNELARIEHSSRLIYDERVWIIPGVEANLDHYISKREDRDRIMTACTWRLIGCHSWFMNLNDASVKDRPAKFEESLHNKQLIKPTAFAHIERGFPNTDEATCALKEIVDIAVANDIFLEINEASIKRKHDIMVSWIKYAKEHNAKFCLGTDAHYCSEVGNFTKTLDLLDEIDLPKSRILNYDKRGLEEFLQL